MPDKQLKPYVIVNPRSYGVARRGAGVGYCGFGRLGLGSESIPETHQHYNILYFPNRIFIYHCNGNAKCCDPLVFSSSENDETKAMEIIVDTSIEKTLNGRMPAHR